MNDVLRLACDSSLLLICGSTLLLGLGCTAVAGCHSPVHRQRLAELTVGGFLIWLVLTLVPLPRLASPWFNSRNDADSAPIRAALPVEQQVFSDPLPQADPLSSILVPLESDELMPSEDFDALLQLSADTAPPTAVLTIEDGELLQPIPAPGAAKSWMSASSILKIVVGLYLIGAAACAALLLIGHCVLLWIRVTGKQPPAWLETYYHDLAGAEHVPVAELLVSQRCSRPITWGLRRPAIVLPDRLCREENRKLVGAILLHELGHVARRDAWGNLLFCIASPLLYCHPLYWWLRRDWNLAAELVADDWAAWQTGKDAYVEELMDLARTSAGNSFPFVGATGVFSSRSQFYRRMQMLLVREQPLATRTTWVWQLASIAVAMLGIALASSLGGVRPAIAQDNPPLPQATPPALDAPVLNPIPTLPQGTPPALEGPAVDPKPAELLKGPDATNAFGLPTVSAPIDPIQSNAPDNPEALIRELRAERAQLEAKLKALQARLNEIAPDAADEQAVTARGLIALTRVDNDGTVWNETWTADERGQPAKLMTRTATGKLPAKGTTEPTTEGKVLKELVQEYDQPKFADEPNVTPSIGVAPPTAEAVASPNSAIPATSTTRIPERAPGFSGHRELDLVSLATSYADAVGNLETAHAKLADLEALAKESPASISKQDVTAARLAVSSAQRKEQLLQRIANVALLRVSKELERATQLHKKGFLPAGELEEVQTHADILRQILSTQLDNQGNSPPGSPSGAIEGRNGLEPK